LDRLKEGRDDWEVLDKRCGLKLDWRCGESSLTELQKKELSERVHVCRRISGVQYEFRVKGPPLDWEGMDQEDALKRGRQQG